MNNWLEKLKQNWTAVYTDKKYLAKFILNFTVSFVLYMWMVHFLVQNRFRAGAVLLDPIQQLFEPHNFSTIIFLLTYTCVISYLVYVIPYPRFMYFVFRAFLAVFIVRVAFIYLVPLAPPPTMILLVDPFTQFVLGNQNLVLNDLFFSGHISSLCILIFSCGYKPLKYFMAVCTVSIAFMLM